MSIFIVSCFSILCFFLHAHNHKCTHDQLIYLFIRRDSMRNKTLFIFFVFFVFLFVKAAWFYVAVVFVDRLCHLPGQLHSIHGTQIHSNVSKQKKKNPENKRNKTHIAQCVWIAVFVVNFQAISNTSYVSICYSFFCLSYYFYLEHLNKPHAINLCR